MSSKVFSISLQTETLEKLDNIRGLVPRSSYIANVLLNHLKNGNTSDRKDQRRGNQEAPKQLLKDES